ncbi:DUF2568 domain-containing protein [Bacillus pacificus]|uniref:DUF2568 domain-containing protein n=1 Tax=Bacillus pacificus TaxID=2026187 RepID=UPI002D786379|nr:DUF2568 domain-containing protein [Bacillus pacificus]
MRHKGKIKVTKKKRTYNVSKASLKLPEPYRFMLEIILFGVSSVALYVVDQKSFAIILAVLFIINRTLIIVWKQ